MFIAFHSFLLSIITYVGNISDFPLSQQGKCIVPVYLYYQQYDCCKCFSNKDAHWACELDGYHPWLGQFGFDEQTYKKELQALNKALLPEPGSFDKTTAKIIRWLCCYCSCGISTIMVPAASLGRQMQAYDQEGYRKGKEFTSGLASRHPQLHFTYVRTDTLTYLLNEAPMQ